jgi:hypothetical protein
MTKAMIVVVAVPLVTTAELEQPRGRLSGFSNSQEHNRCLHRVDTPLLVVCKTSSVGSERDIGNECKKMLAVPV